MTKARDGYHGIPEQFYFIKVTVGGVEERRVMGPYDTEGGARRAIYYDRKSWRREDQAKAGTPARYYIVPVTLTQQEPEEQNL